MTIEKPANNLPKGMTKPRKEINSKKEGNHSPVAKDNK
jgi:hypothetical protein